MDHNRAPKAARKAAKAGRFGVVLALTAILSAPAQALTCPAADEQSSLTVRVLQAKLMVAALTCPAQSDYNAFVRRYTPYLADHAVSLKRWFRKLHGGRQTQEIDRFVTTLANDASMKSTQNRAKFCAASRSAFTVLLGAPKAEARQILQSVALELNWRRDIPSGCEALTQNVRK